MAEISSKAKRKLPVLGHPTSSSQTLLSKLDTGESSGEERSPVAWIMLGVMGAFVVLVPLGLLLMPLFRVFSNIAHEQIRLILQGIFSVGAVFLSILWGAYMIGRWGGRAKLREAVFVGIITGCMLWALSRMGAGAIIVLPSLAASWVGGRLGLKHRPRG